MPRRRPLVIRAAKNKKQGGGKVTIPPAGRAKIQAMATEGFDQISIAASLGISKQTLVACRDRDEKVEEAWAVGHAKLADEITHLLLEQGRKGNTVALIYLSKARLGWTDQPQPEERAPAVVIHLPDARSPEEYMRLIKHQPSPGLPAPTEVPDILSGQRVNR